MARNGSVMKLGNIKKRSEYRSRIKNYERILIGILIFSFLVFVAIAGFAIYKEGLENFVLVVKSINLGYYALSLLAVFVAYVIRFPKWELYMKSLGVRLARAKNFMIYLSMYSMDITPGRWGRAVVSYTINRITGTRFSRTFPAIVADIFTDFAGFAFVAIIAAFIVQQYLLVAIILTVLLLIPFIFLYNRRAYSLFRDRLRKKRFFRKMFAFGDRYFRHNRLLSKRVYVYSMIYTVPSMALNAVSLYFVMLAFGVHVGIAYLPLIVFIFTMSTLLGMVTGLPANLGVTDAALFGFLIATFGSFGVGFDLASVITIFSRVANVWFVQLFGFGSLAYTIRYWKK
ncbi:MAG: flippase-like domain-containing protein [Candidatus Micrarchaeota archaeon]|nr:flippase-like domain-containing protein [Candidatus Micrarchaeota archaeon]MDE1847633.1 flippase-like domain-containing protein [Candidatus Micrarchaeota archaeon]MDE1864454.1 flippase-like domain-containing protein [Candidatus Micrarchaeota archaeon]